VSDDDQMECGNDGVILSFIRCEAIRSFLETPRKTPSPTGPPLQCRVRQYYLDDEEDKALLMEEARSIAASSTLSLHRPAARPSGKVPLADLSSELRLSVISVNSLASTNSEASSAAEESRVETHRVSVHGVPGWCSSSSEEDVTVEVDRNVTELTFANSGLEEDVLVKSADCRSRHGSSDSGYSAERAAASSPEESPSARQGRKSPTSDVGSSSSSPSPRVMGRRAQRKCEEDDGDLTVLSEETVTVLAGDRYAYAPKAKAGARPKYTPPRALASIREEEGEGEDFNQGCYYFMACLDSFWIL